MGKYYFTYEGDHYGTHTGVPQDTPRRQPFKGGWTEVEAPSLLSAHGIYNDIHPQAREREGFWFYNRVFDEADFLKSGFAETGINGYTCVERISLNVEVLERGGYECVTSI